MGGVLTREVEPHEENKIKIKIKHKHNHENHIKTRFRHHGFRGLSRARTGHTQAHEGHQRLRCVLQARRRLLPQCGHDKCAPCCDKKTTKTCCDKNEVSKN